MSTSYTILKKDALEIELHESSNRFQIGFDDDGPMGLGYQHLDASITPEDLVGMALEMLKVASYWTDPQGLKAAVQTKVGADFYLRDVVRQVGEAVR